MSFFLIERNNNSGVSINTSKHVGYFAHRGRLLFYRKKKQLDLFSERPTGFTLCFSHLNAIFEPFFETFLQVYAEFVYVQKYVI